MLQFRTTRVAGARILVDYDTDDIVRIRKTKSIDLMLWHSNGLSLDMVDGEVSQSVPEFFSVFYCYVLIVTFHQTIHFENVLKRDECFNKLLGASGKKLKRF